MNNTKTGRKLLIIIVILAIAGGIGAVVGLQKQIIDFLNDEANYQKYKCNPFFMPFIHLSKHSGSSSETSAVKRDRNFKQCIAGIADPILEEEKKPLTALLGRITELNGKLASEANIFRTMAGYLRASYLNVIKTTVDRVFGLKDAVANQYNVIQNLMKKQAALMSLFIEFTKSLGLIFKSFEKGPIPRITEFMLKFWPAFIVFFTSCVLCMIPLIGLIWCPICAICFTPDSEIPTINGYRKINDIAIGNILADRSIVLGKVSVLAGGTELYEIHPRGSIYPVICTGSHLIQDGDRWVRARNYSKAKLFTKEYRGLLVCLITSTNRIPVGDVVFRDYQEISEPKYVAEIKYRYANHLNHIDRPVEISFDDLRHTYYWGFNGNTLFETKRGGVLLKNIEVGDVLEYGDKIYDRVIGRASYSGVIPMWKYNGVRVSGTTLVKEDGIWKQVRYSNRAESAEFENIVYNLITESGIIRTGETEWRDFMDTHDEDFNDSIDDYLEELVNNLGDD